MTTSPIIGTTQAPKSTMATLPSAPAQTTGGGTESLGSDAFLKLLVAQLKYQDPMNPAKGTDFMAQTAQFTMVEKLTEMAKQNASALTGQQTLAATQMVGHQVAYLDSLGNSLKGVVSSVQLLPAGPSLTINGKPVAFTSITDVGPASATPSGAASTGTASTASQQLQQAAELVGHPVAYTDARGGSATGVVSSVKLLPTGLTLVIDGKNVPASAVTEVQPLAPITPTSPDSLLAMLGPTIAAALAAVHAPATTPTTATTSPATTTTSPTTTSTTPATTATDGGSTTPATTTSPITDSTSPAAASTSPATITATDGGSTTSSTATDGVSTSI